MARIRNKKTGEIIDVADDQLSSYGISPTPTMATAQPEIPEQQDFITGRSIQDHARALGRAQAEGDTAAVKQIKDDYNREYSYQKDIVMPKQKAEVEMKAKTLKEKTDKESAVSSVTNSLDLFEKNFLEAGLRGKALGMLPSGTGLSPESADFDAQRETLAYELAKAIGGQSGQGLSDKDFKNYLKLVPSRTDTDQEARNKMQNIREKIAGKFNAESATKTSLPEGEKKTLLQRGMAIGDAVMGTAARVAKDINAGTIAKITDPTRRKAAEIGFATAKSLEEQAASESDPEKKKALLTQANTIYQNISRNAEDVRETFSKDVYGNPAIRGVGAASQIVGAAEVIANPSIAVNAVKAPIQAVRHPIQTAKSVGSIVRHPVIAAKEFIKQDIANTGYKGTGFPGAPKPDLSLKTGSNATKSGKSLGELQAMSQRQQGIGLLADYDAATQTGDKAAMEKIAQQIVDMPDDSPYDPYKSIFSKRVGLSRPAAIPTKPLDKQLIHSVRQVDLPPSVYGHGKEEAVNATLDRLGFQGDASEQYAMLQPKMDELGDHIQRVMAANPKSVPVDSIVKDFDRNLSREGIYRTAQLSRDTAQKEARSYIADLFNNATGNDIVPTDIPDTELLNLKQMINKDYKSVARKLENGVSLTDREKVISVARQTVDDILSALHPDVKEATVMQSHLFDAAESLYKARHAKSPGVYAFGTKISLPTKAVQKAKDFIGHAIQ